MTSRITKVLLVLAVAGLILAGMAVAQNTTTSTTTTSTTQTPPQSAPPANVGPGSREQCHGWENHVNQREQNQQNRIANGIKNGQLNAGQAAHLENRENAIQNREAADEAEHGGHLTKQEKAHFKRAQNNLSKQIHNDKHPK